LAKELVNAGNVIDIGICCRCGGCSRCVCVFFCILAFFFLFFLKKYITKKKTIIKISIEGNTTAIDIAVDEIELVEFASLSIVSARSKAALSAFCPAVSN